MGVSLFRIKNFLKNLNFEYEKFIDAFCDVQFSNMRADIAKCTIASCTFTIIYVMLFETSHVGQRFSRLIFGKRI